MDQIKVQKATLFLGLDMSRQLLTPWFVALGKNFTTITFFFKPLHAAVVPVIPPPGCAEKRPGFITFVTCVVCDGTCNGLTPHVITCLFFFRGIESGRLIQNQ